VDACRGWARACVLYVEGAAAVLIVLIHASTHTRIHSCTIMLSFQGARAVGRLANPVALCAQAKHGGDAAKEWMAKVKDTPTENHAAVLEVLDGCELGSRQWDGAHDGTALILYS
jgi:hypothetical protein